MPEPPTEARKTLPLGTKPSYYIVLRRFPIIAGLMQVEIMAIISPAEVGGASFSMSKSLCVEVDGSRLINCKKKKAQGRILCSAIRHLPSQPHQPSLHPSRHTPPPILSITPRFSPQTDLTILASACSVSFPTVGE